MVGRTIRNCVVVTVPGGGVVVATHERHLFSRSIEKVLYVDFGCRPELLSELMIRLHHLPSYDFADLLKGLAESSPRVEIQTQGVPLTPEAIRKAMGKPSPGTPPWLVEAADALVEDTIKTFFGEE